MNIEKIVNSRIYRFFDWVWRIAILNILTLLTSLGIVSILSSLTACYKTIYNYYEGSSENVFKAYFTNFKHHFFEPLKGNILVISAAIVFSVAIIYYSSNLNGENVLATISVIGFYFVIFLIIISLLIIIQLPMIYSNFYFRYFDYFRFAIILSFKNILLSVIYLVTFVLCNLLFWYLLPVWFICGLSLPLLLGHILFKKIYWRLINPKINKEEEEKNEIRN